MQIYEKTNWVNDETYLNATNMNKIEEQLETLTNNAIEQNEKGYLTNIPDEYITENELEEKKYVTETYVLEKIEESIGQVLGGSY